MLSLTVILLAASALPLGSGFRGRPGTDNPYYGRMIGKLQEYAHGIRGIVYAVDESTMFVKGFSYDGTGPDAFFWVGNTARPSPDGFIVAYPEDYVGRDPPILNAYNRTDVILRLPNGKRIRDLKWLSVWCRRFTVNFGDLFIPSGLEIPKARILPEFRRLAHGLRSGNITVLDAKTFYIPNLHYDGAGPDAYFWVGNGTEPTPLGVKVPNEMGSLEPLRGYQGEDIEIQLPGSLTVYDIDWLAVWCVQYRHNFGHVNIPKDLDVPPALGQTKITTSSTASTSTTEASGYSNCREMLDERLQVMWEKQGDNVEIKLAGRIREDQYIAFGISGEPGRAAMVGADVVVAYYDLDRQTFHAVDYYITASSQCDGKNGVCPDERLGGRNDVTMLSGERKSGVTTIKFRRPLQTNEPINDKPILSEGEISIIAAIGPLNSRKEANAHDYRDRTLDDIRIDFSSVNDHSCINSLFNLPEDDSIMAWPVEKIIGETTLSARIGPTGGRRGYTAVTGHPSWGIAWWINDKLIPQVFVERGKTYTFVIEGGDDETNPARYHPFYITDSSEGGYGQKTEHERRQQRLFAGVTFDSEGNPQPTAPGRYCEWAHKTIDMSSESATFAEFFQTLRLMCDEGEPGYLNWTVKEQTPDLVYYQCYTHNNLGWKIHVVDAGWSQSQNGTSSVLSPHRPLALLLPSVLSFLIISRTLLSR